MFIKFFTSLIFRFATFVCYFVTSFLKSLSVTPLLYIEPLNGIIVITSKHSTVLLSINKVEVTDREYQKMQL